MPLTMEEFRAFEPQKETYALFGYPIGHTMSPALHSMLFAAAERDAEYIAVAVSPEDLPEALEIARKKLHGINLTIPHKKAVLSLLDSAEQGASDLQSVNTVSLNGGNAIGYNTDILGFGESLEKDGICLRGKKVLLLGYGGVASVMAYHCVRSGAFLTITGRNVEKANALRSYLQNFFPNAKIEVCTRKQIPKDIQIVVNGTPLGMSPHETACPLYFLPRKTEYVFDAIYNPPITSTMRLAKARKTKTRDGLYMLVMQAAHAQTIWTGKTTDNALCDRVLKHLYAEMAKKRLYEVHGKQNIVLCGFMGAGKTTVGKKLAKLCKMQFIDADRYLEEREGRKIPEIFSADGEIAFRDLESKYLLELSRKSDCVIALGGGAVLREQNVAAVKQSGLLIYLNTPFTRIRLNLENSTNRPLLDKNNANRMEEMKRLYHLRKNVYAAAADRSVRAARLNDMIDRILKSI